jgi:hypothetical protein
MDKVILPQVGDVIRSTRFVYGEKSFDKTNKRIVVGRKTPQYIVSRYPTDEEIVAYVKEHDQMPPKGAYVEEDYGAPDPTREDSEFVVIEARMQGGGTGHGPHDVYPDGWHVVAKRLKEGRVWNSEGEEIMFYMSGCFTNLILSQDVEVVGKMKIGFV